MKTLGERIALHRNMRLWTQDRLASALGITQGLLSAIENNRISPKWDLINKIAEQLEFQVLRLLPLDTTNMHDFYDEDPGTEETAGYKTAYKQAHLATLVEALVKTQEELLSNREEIIKELRKQLAVK